jgi:ribonuclease R
MKSRALHRGGAAKGARGKPSRAPESETWEGALSVHPRGFGFVACAGRDDVYVPREAIGPALHGDTVRVSIVARTSRGLEGRVDRVVKRRSPRVAGILHKRRQSSWLEPDDTRIRGPIVIHKGGDKAAEGSEGDAAVVTITRFPETPDENPVGELVLVLGEPGDPNVEVAKILLREGIEEQHGDEALREAEAMSSRLSRRDAEGRRDLRDVPFLTIDPEDARDHDDAVFAQRTADGFRAWVAIADVSEYVQPGTALDEEALKRGCTIYLPDRALPMLPAALAADVCSLLPERERLCLCVIADIDDDGAVTSFDVCEGRMRGAAMLTYGSVARTLGFTEKPPRSPQAEGFKNELRDLDDVARRLRKVRMRRGALDFDLPEPKLTLDEITGNPVGVTRRAQDPGVKRAYQMIEELMILANELVAQWLGKRRAPAVYRVHGKPDEKKLERLGNVCERLGAPFEFEELVEKGGIGKWLRDIAEHPRRAVLESLVLRSMKQAVYDIHNIGHFGLASEAYVHFTSPIRRYPDVEVHRSVKRLLAGVKPDTSPAAIEELAAAATASSVRERAAMDVEREVVDLYRALLMRDRVGDVFEGTVTGVTGTGVYVSLDEPFVDVLVRYESMGPDQYEIDDDEIGVFGRRSGERIDLGDRMTVTVEDVLLTRRLVYARRVITQKALAAMEADEAPRYFVEGGRPRRPEPKPRFQPEGRRGNPRNASARPSQVPPSGGGKAPHGDKKRRPEPPSSGRPARGGKTESRPSRPKKRKR